ncbi:MAG: NAD(+) synthase [Christensenellaceae bacterium]
MQYGLIKVAAASPDLRVADVAYNAAEIKKTILEEYAAGVQVLVFPELCLSGYTCSDLFHQKLLIDGCLREAEKLVEESKGMEMLVFIGLPVLYQGSLYNCALAFSNGRALGLVPKTYLPSYNEFYEQRHFASGKDLCGSVTLCAQTVPLDARLLFTDENCPELKIGCEICEDLWVGESPSLHHAKAGATLIVNLSASNEVIGKREYRRDLVRLTSGKLVCGYVYASAGMGESTTDTVYSGHNLIAENGAIYAEARLFSGETVRAVVDVEKMVYERKRLTDFTADESEREIFFATPVREAELIKKPDRFPFVPSGEDEMAKRAELILSIQAAGLLKRLKHTRAKTAVLGISGGLDSALAFLVTIRAFDLLKKDRKDVVAVTMPGFGTTGKTKNNAIRLVEELGASVRTVSIVDAVNQHFQDIGHDPAVHDVTYENAQARMRTLILMDIANETGGLVIGTGDLSELALGWATYNGDHMSMYSVNASVPKTLVKFLIAYEAKRLTPAAMEILTDILNTEISPELLPPDMDGEITQKTEDIVGPYELHDFFLYYIVRWGFEPKKVEFLANTAFEGKYDSQTVHKWLVNFYRRFFAHQFKRSCMPDAVKVGSVTLSPRADWRMPSDAVASLWLKELE